MTSASFAMIPGMSIDWGQCFVHAPQAMQFAGLSFSLSRSIRCMIATFGVML